MDAHTHPLDYPPVSYDCDSYDFADGRHSPPARRERPARRRGVTHPVERPMRLGQGAVRDLMTPGVVTISDDASLRQAYRAMAKHGVNSLLVLGAQRATPLGWVTARGLLAHLGRDPDLFHAGQAVTEPAVTIHPSATADEALTALSQPGVSQLMVTRGEDRLPQGVVTAIDLIRVSAG